MNLFIRHKFLLRPRILAGVLTVLVPCMALEISQAEVLEVPLVNPEFRARGEANGVPEGWSLYGGREVGQRLAVTLEGLLLQDGNAHAEIGVIQVVPVAPGKNYEIRVAVRAVAGGIRPSRTRNDCA